MSAKREMRGFNALDTVVTTEQERKSTQKGLRDGETRATFILDAEKLETLKDLAYTERITIRELVDDMVSEYLKAHIDEHGMTMPSDPSKKSEELCKRPGSKR